MINEQVLWNCVLIFLARIIDVSLGTLRTAYVIQRRSGLAFITGFFEALIWLVIIQRILSHLNHPLYFIFYALGFGAGNYTGVLIENLFAVGTQVLTIFTRDESMAKKLRENDYIVSLFRGEGRDGLVNALYIRAQRKNVPKLLQTVISLDSKANYMIEDIQKCSDLPSGIFVPSGWRAIIKKK